MFGFESDSAPQMWLSFMLRSNLSGLNFKYSYYVWHGLKALTIQGPKLYNVLCLESEMTAVMKHVKLQNNKTVPF